MSHPEKNMTETESIQLITSMINKAKNRFSETGILYIFWGWLIFLCCIVQFIALYFFNNQNAYYIWYLTWLAPIYQVIYLRKRKKKRAARTYTGEITSYVWLVFMICTTLLVFILIYFKLYQGINPAVLVMYGMPTILSGVILKFNPLKFGGACCWLLSIAAVLTDYQFQLLLIALAVVIAWIVPGYLLKAKFKNENLV
ncbi:MAG: hypothetical protein ABIR19_02320 [Ginsengibacter sp.]